MVRWPSWLKAADCKSADIVYVGSNPTLTTRGYRAFYLRVTLNPTEAYGLLYGLPFKYINLMIKIL